MVMIMEKEYSFTLDMINTIIDKLNKGTDYKSIKEYLENEKTKIEIEKSKLKDNSSEYIVKLVNNLK